MEFSLDLSFQPPGYMSGKYQSQLTGGNGKIPSEQVGADVSKTS